VRAHTKLTFGDIGKIRVGVKTTADKIFVKGKWPERRPEVIWPLASNDSRQAVPLVEIDAEDGLDLSRQPTFQRKLR